MVQYEPKLNEHRICGFLPVMPNDNPLAATISGDPQRLMDSDGVDRISTRAPPHPRVISFQTTRRYNQLVQYS